MDNIKQQQQTLPQLLNGQQQLLSINKVNSFAEVINSQEKTLFALIKQGRQIELGTLIITNCLVFLNINSPANNNEALATQFAEDIIETRLTWKLSDISYFFKFIRQRQDIEACRIMGNKITGIKLMELVAIYEDHRAQEYELINRQKYQQEIIVDRVATKQVVAESVGEIMKKVLPEPKQYVASDPEKLGMAYSDYLQTQENDKRCKELIAEFEALNPVMKGTDRVVVIDGKPCTIKQYMDRHTEL